MCSLEPEEGEGVVAQAPEGLIPDPITPDEAPSARIAPQGWLRTLPSDAADQGGMDGFFAARFRKA